MANFDVYHGRNTIENIYLFIMDVLKQVPIKIVPYLRRFIRFIALPYCYFKLVDWKECKASRYQVVKDFLYIFFILKYYPDNYSLCRFWEMDRKQWHYYYGSIYDPYQRKKLRKKVQKKKYEILFEDKFICYQLCKAADLPIPKHYAVISPEDDYKLEILNILDSGSNIKVIIKAIGGYGGSEIYIVYKKNNKIYVYGDHVTYSLDEFVLRSPSVVQEYIIQHKSLSNISSSVNTVRIVTYYSNDKKEVLILGAYMRSGISHEYIDNICTGGIGLKVHIETGVVDEIAYGFNGIKFKSHPKTGFTFKDFKIPQWTKIVQLAKKIQSNFSYFGLLGHDIALSEDGPVIIEVNAIPDIVAFEMLCGPILANPSILNEFKKDNLLINKYQKRLCIRD